VRLPEQQRDFVTLQKKETLYNIAQKNGVQLESLLEYNQLSEDGEVPAGTRLYLKAIAEKDKPKAIPGNLVAAKSVVYEVQPKDGLYTVAKKYSVTVQQLKEWNNLMSDDLKVGQQLIVSK
jgi:LysM repeat protein